MKRVPAFITELVLPRTPQETFDFICDLSKWPLFRGFGPVPGIVEATVPGGGPIAMGSRIRVVNTDKSVHHEVVVGLERGRLYVVRMEMTPPASYLIAGIEETVELEGVSGGTKMIRRFAVTPRSILTAPLAWLICHVFLRKAVDAHNAALPAAL